MMDFSLERLSPDAIRPITGKTVALASGNETGSTGVFDYENVLTEYGVGRTGDGFNLRINFDVRRVVPTSYENCSAAMTVWLVISY